MENNKRNNWVFIFLLGSIFLLGGCFFSAYLPTILGDTFYSICVGIACVTLIMLLIVCFRYKNDKKIIIVSIVSMVIAGFPLFTDDYYHQLHSKIVLGHYLKKDYSNYKILNLAARNTSNYYFKCKYVYNVSLEDGSDVIFQAGYCDRPNDTWTTPFQIFNNSFSNYIGYIAKHYNKETGAKIRVKTNIHKDYFDEVPTILYSNIKEFNEVKKFILYISGNNICNKHKVNVYDDVSKAKQEVSLWTNDYNLISFE